MGRNHRAMSPRESQTTIGCDASLHSMIESVVLGNEEVPCEHGQDDTSKRQTAADAAQVMSEDGQASSSMHGRIGALKKEMKSRLLAQVMRVALSPLRMRPRRLASTSTDSLTSWPEVLDPRSPTSSLRRECIVQRNVQQLNESVESGVQPQSSDEVGIHTDAAVLEVHPERRHLEVEQSKHVLSDK